MPELILMRHAQAAPAAVDAEDFTRPLTAAGRKAAAQAARAIAAAGAQVERVLLSPAYRTRDTAAIVAEVLGLGPSVLQAVPELYAAAPEGIHAAIAHHHAGAGCLLIIGHNPGISVVAGPLSARHAREHLPTAGWWRLPISAARWQRLTQP